MRTLTLIFLSLVILLGAQFVHAQDFAALVQSGEAARQRGEYQQAFASFDEALKLAEEAGDKSEQAQIFISRGHIHYLQAEYNAAIRAFRQAEKLANSVNDKREEARAWAFLGQLYWRVGKVEDSRMFLKDALRVFETTNDEINLALVLRFIGRFEDGRGLTTKSFSQSADATKNSLTTYNSQGVFYKSLNALQFYNRSLAISQRIGDEEGELTTLKEIGLVYQGQFQMVNFLERAMSYFAPLRIRLKDSNYRFLYAVVLNNIATNEYYSGRDKTSVEFYSRRMAKVIATTDEAARIFREIGDRQELREMLDRKANCMLFLERFAEALPLIDESIQIADELYHQPIGGELDRSRYFESLIWSYRIKTDALYGLNRPAEMFETHEAMKSLALRDLMNRGKDDKKRTLTGDELLEEKRLDAELNSINRQLLQIKQTDKAAALRLVELNRQLQKVRLAKEEWQANIAAENEKSEKPVRAQNLNISQMCEAIPDKNTAFIEYQANNIYLGATFILMKTDADFTPSIPIKNLLTEKITLPDGETCAINVFFNKGYWDNKNYPKWATESINRMSEFREQITRKSPAFKQNAQFIYDALIADATSLLKDKTHLVIIPNGIICDVPFQALMNENGRYLIEDFAISYAPSITTLAEMQANRRKLAAQKYDGDFLAFGNPKLSEETVAKVRSRYRSGKIGDLPEAETEVRTIGASYPNSLIFVGRNATENMWLAKASKYRILHLATHGLSDADKPLYSHVLLSADAGDDGLIEGREIAAMNLTAEMVVLSACETARGREIDGEGMVGLSWAFAAAGVPTVIAANWKVDSLAAADIMVDFYTKLNGTGKITKVEALQQAMIEKLSRTKNTHPFYWAGFSLYGEWAD